VCPGLPRGGKEKFPVVIWEHNPQVAARAGCPFNGVALCPLYALATERDVWSTSSESTGDFCNGFLSPLPSWRCDLPCYSACSRTQARQMQEILRPSPLAILNRQGFPLFACRSKELPTPTSPSRSCLSLAANRGEKQSIPIRCETGCCYEPSIRIDPFRFAADRLRLW
jgi:hypothetical protein